MRSSLPSRVLLFLLVTASLNVWSADGRIVNFEGDVRVNGQPVTAETVLKREDTIMTSNLGAVTVHGNGVERCNG